MNYWELPLRETGPPADVLRAGLCANCTFVSINKHFELDFAFSIFLSDLCGDPVNHTQVLSPDSNKHQ